MKYCQDVSLWSVDRNDFFFLFFPFFFFFFEESGFQHFGVERKTVKRNRMKIFKHGSF